MIQAAEAAEAVAVTAAAEAEAAEATEAEATAGKNIKYSYKKTTHMTVWVVFLSFHSIFK